MGVVSEAYEFHVGGSARRYLVLRRDGVVASTVPTIIDVHGSGSWPEEHVAVTGARSLAALGAVVIVPQAAIPYRLLTQWPVGWAWNVPGSPLPGETIAREEPDDLAFIAALTARVVERHGVDPGRMHLRGYSGGARLASHVLAAMTTRLTSVCCVGGIRFIKPAVGDLPPLLAIHGSLDGINPCEGGNESRWSESVETVARRWASAAGCESAPQSVVSDRVTHTRYIDSAGFATVRLIVVANATHSWPGTTHEDHIAQFGASGTFDASRAHWGFVREVDRLRD